MPFANLSEGFKITRSSGSKPSVTSSSEPTSRPILIFLIRTYSFVRGRGRPPQWPPQSRRSAWRAKRLRVLPELRFAPDNPYHQVAQGCWNQFEPIIRSHPEYWLWLYKHWRYKPSRATRPYPFYSNHSVQFDLEIKSQEHPERAK